MMDNKQHRRTPKSGCDGDGSWKKDGDHHEW